MKSLRRVASGALLFSVVLSVAVSGCVVTIGTVGRAFDGNEGGRRQESTPSMANQLLNELDEELKVYLQQEHRLVPKIFASLERAVQVERKKLVYWVIFVLSLYLVVGYAAELLCNTIGLAYPALASFEAIETPDKDDDTQWLTYWTVFGTVSLIDFASDKILALFPAYWLGKCIFLLWLQLPYFRGAQRLHRHFFGSIYRRFRPALYAAGIEVKQEAQSLIGVPPVDDNQPPQPIDEQPPE